MRNAGPEAAAIDVLPTLWFRNTWSWGIDDATPSIRLENGALVAEHARLGARVLAGDGSAGGAVLRERDEHASGCGACPSATPYPKDGINDHVVRGAATVNPDHDRDEGGVPLPARGRRRRDGDDRAAAERRPAVSATTSPRSCAAREAEADEFYADADPGRRSTDEALVLRQALAGMLWSKQFYHYDVRRWLGRRPGRPAPARVTPERRATTTGRTSTTST